MGFGKSLDEGSKVSRPKTSDEVRDEFMNACRDSVDYWASSGIPSHYSIHDRLSGLLHSLLVIVDGSSGSFDCSLDLVCRPHPDDKEYSISEDEDWVEDGTVLNDEHMLHELLYGDGHGERWEKVKND